MGPRRGWALWKSLITLAGRLEEDAPGADVIRREIGEVIADHAAAGW